MSQGTRLPTDWKELGERSWQRTPCARAGAWQACLHSITGTTPDTRHFKEGSLFWFTVFKRIQSIVGRLQSTKGMVENSGSSHGGRKHRKKGGPGDKNTPFRARCGGACL